MITLTLIIIFNIVNGILLCGWNTHLDLLYQKSIRYQHHRENYLTSLLEVLLLPPLSVVSDMMT